VLLFLAIVQKAENTVAMPVILKTASEVIAMTDEQFNRESRYRVAMCIARTMLHDGLISSDDYHIIDKTFIEKYRPIYGEL